MKKGLEDQTEEDKGNASTPKGRGRGRGRGKGRGRGWQTTANNAGTSASNQTTSDDTLTAKKGKADGKHKDEDWARWGSDDAWSYQWDSWEEYHEWAWDSYENQQLAASSELAPANGKHAKDPKKKKTKKSETDKTDKIEEAPKQKRRRETKKPHDQEETAGTEMIPEVRSRKSKKPKEEAETPVAPEQVLPPRPKRSRKAKEQEAEPEEEENDGTKAGEEDEEHAVEASTTLPHTKDLRLKEILKFVKGFNNMSDEDARLLMRGRLSSVYACRMDVYYDRPGVGVTCRADKKSFAYFSNSQSNVRKILRLAAAMKAAEMCVPCFKFAMSNGIKHDKIKLTIYRSTYILVLRTGIYWVKIMLLVFTHIYLPVPSAFNRVEARFVDEVKKRKGVKESDRIWEHTAVVNMNAQLKEILVDAVTIIDHKWQTP